MEVNLWHAYLSGLLSQKVAITGLDCLAMQFHLHFAAPCWDTTYYPASPFHKVAFLSLLRGTGPLSHHCGTCLLHGVRGTVSESLSLRRRCLVYGILRMRTEEGREPEGGLIKHPPHISVASVKPDM